MPSSRLSAAAGVEGLAEGANLSFVRAENEPICWELFGWRAVRLGHWKATWIAAPFGVNDWQLFDLAVDPGETRDLADDQPKRLHDLVNVWEVCAEEVGVVMPGKTDSPTQQLTRMRDTIQS